MLAAAPIRPAEPRWRARAIAHCGRHDDAGADRAPRRRPRCRARDAARGLRTGPIRSFGIDARNRDSGHEVVCVPAGQSSLIGGKSSSSGVMSVASKCQMAHLGRRRFDDQPSSPSLAQSMASSTPASSNSTRNRDSLICALDTGSHAVRRHGFDVRSRRLCRDICHGICQPAILSAVSWTLRDFNRGAKRPHSSCAVAHPASAAMKLRDRASASVAAPWMPPVRSLPPGFESGPPADGAARATPVMEQYIEIKAANPDCLLFYRMGDFYELFFEDAEVASRALGIVLTKRGKHLGRDIPMCGVPIAPRRRISASPDRARPSRRGLRADSRTRPRRGSAARRAWCGATWCGW